jgi:hypothetical protein
MINPSLFVEPVEKEIADAGDGGLRGVHSEGSKRYQMEFLQNL